MAPPESQEGMTTVELTAELKHQLELVRSQLASAEGEELRRLLRREEGIKDVIEKIQPEPTPGIGTTGEASRGMRRKLT